MVSNMKEVSREESKRIMLDLLKDIALVCDNNNIRYYLAAGTLIGAIRHQGFIPWDDDIDIEISRPDYDRFIGLYRKKGKFSICAPFEKDSIYLYAKVYDDRTLVYEDGVDYSRFNPLGISIDIFPIDGQPGKEHNDDFLRQVKVRRIISFLFGYSISSLKIGSLKGKLLKIICRIFSKNFFSYLYIKSVTRYSFTDSPMAGFVAPYRGYDVKHRHNRDVYRDRVKVKFEDDEFWAPIGYDEYLRDVYGDYMQLPPIEQQQTHHYYKAFWK